MAGRGRGQGQGKGHGQGHGRGRDGGLQPDDMADAAGRSDTAPDDMDGPPDSLIRHGRSDDSPGHRKKAAGAQSARDFAPGRNRQA
jgi:hypothetical protein